MVSFKINVGFARNFLKMWQSHTYTTVLRLYGFCPGQSKWAGNRRNIHPLRPIVVINRPSSDSSIYYDLWRPPCSNCEPQSFSTISLQVFFGLPLGLAPFTPYSIHFDTLSFSSFHNTRPYHCNVFCCSTDITSSNTSLCVSTFYMELCPSNDSHLMWQSIHAKFISQHIEAGRHYATSWQEQRHDCLFCAVWTIQQANVASCRLHFRCSSKFAWQHGKFGLISVDVQCRSTVVLIVCWLY